MADIELTRAHSMSKEEAREAANRVARDLEDQLDATSRWDGDTLHFERVATPSADGRLDVRGDEMRVAINLSLMLKPMKGQIRSQAEDLLEKHLK